MEYNLKEKLIVTKSFLDELVIKSWQDLEAIQQQIKNIDASNTLGNKTVELLKTLCVNYYTFIGCLENLAETTEFDCVKISDQINQEVDIQTLSNYTDSAAREFKIDTADNNFEPFEYFVDFDAPTGEPITDKDLYN